MVSQLSGPIPTIIAAVYRPPKPNKGFFNDFASSSWGDCNIRMDNVSNTLHPSMSPCLSFKTNPAQTMFYRNIKDIDMDNLSAGIECLPSAESLSTPTSQTLK